MKRIFEIDILRSIATIMLLFHHAGIYQLQVFGITLKSLVRAQVGFALLGIFIFLSGLLLGLSIKHQPQLALKDYYLRRFSRLIPPYIVAVFLFKLLLPVDLNGAELWIHLFGLQILLAPTYSIPVITLWYFSLLVLCLLIVPIGLKKFNTLHSSFRYLLATYLVALVLHEEYQILEFRYFYFFGMFAAGGLIGRYHQNQRGIVEHPLMGLGSFVILVVTGYRLFKSQTTYFEELHWGHIAWANLYMLSFTHLAFLLSTKLKNLPQIRFPVSRISRGSYFSYMYHRPLWAIFLLPFSIPEGLLLFCFQFFIGTPLVIALSSKLQLRYDKFISQSPSLFRSR